MRRVIECIGSGRILKLDRDLQELGARLEEVALTIHAHPTMSEAFHESALAALGHPLHI